MDFTHLWTVGTAHCRVVGTTFRRVATHTRGGMSHRSHRLGRGYQNYKHNRIVGWRVTAQSPLTLPRSLHPRPVRSQPRLCCLRGTLIDPLVLLLSQLRLPACGRLIARTFTPHELPSLVEAIFLSNNTDDAIRSLVGEDAQTFVDAIDEVRPASPHRKFVN
jgi:hypothetical protein